MQWILYLLSKHTDIQEQLLNTVRTNNDSHNLLKGIVKEALRLYPVAPFLTRILSENLSLGGYLIPKEVSIANSKRG